MKTNRDIIKPALRASGLSSVIDIMPAGNKLDYPAKWDSPAMNMYELFDWSLTREGFDFWHKVKEVLLCQEEIGDEACSNAEMKARDEAPAEPTKLPCSPKPEPQHWTARMAPIGITNPNFFSFLLR